MTKQDNLVMLQGKPILCSSTEPPGYNSWPRPLVKKMTNRGNFPKPSR